MAEIRVLVLPEEVEAGIAQTPRGDFAVIHAAPASVESPRGFGVLVHGWTGSKEDFAAVLPLLARNGWAAVAYDQRGASETAGYPTSDDYTWDHLGADAAAVAAWFVQEQSAQPGSVQPGFVPPGSVHLVGHSFGGLVAANAVAADPERWATVTFLCSGPAGKDDPPSLVGLTRLATELAGLAVAYPPGPARALSMGAIWDAMRQEGADPVGAPDIEAWLHDRFTRHDPAGLSRFSRMLADAPDRIDDVARAEVPGFVVYGESDDAWPLALQDAMAARLGSTPVVIAGAGHSPAVDQPETLADVLTGLWAGQHEDDGTDDEPAA